MYQATAHLIKVGKRIESRSTVLDHDKSNMYKNTRKKERLLDKFAVLRHCSCQCKTTIISRTILDETLNTIILVHPSIRSLRRGCSTRGVVTCFGSCNWQDAYSNRIMQRAHGLYKVQHT